LLLLHPNLEVFGVAGENTLATALESPWTSGSFINLKSVDVHVGSITSEGLQQLWNEYTKLTHLEVKPTASLALPNRSAVIHEKDFLPSPTQTMLGPTKEDGSSPTGQSVKALRLVYLRLVSIALPKDLTKTFQRIDVLALSELHLDSFAGSGGLLEGVIASVCQRDLVSEEIKHLSPSGARYRGLHHGPLPVAYFILRLTEVGAVVQGLRKG
jgi:hypothetical protein